MTFLLSILFLLAVIPPAHATGVDLEIFGHVFILAAFLLIWVLYRVVSRRRKKTAAQTGEKQFDHSEHLGLSMLTLGLWLPFWLLAWIIFKVRNRSSA